MNRRDAELVLAAKCLLTRAEHPELSDVIRSGVRTGWLTKIIPGVYTAPGLAADPVIRMRAVCRRHPRGVLTGAAAARLLYDHRRRVDDITLAVPSDVVDRAGFRFVRRRVPKALITTRSGLRVTTPALTALDLAAVEGGSAIDDVLRLRAASLGELADGLPGIAGRSGSGVVRRLLRDSRDQPWSEAERLLHRLLRAHGVRGWRGNHEIWAWGNRYFGDVTFPRLRLILEVDGWEFHRDSFEYDHRRRTTLAAAGWMIVGLTWAMLQDPTTMAQISSLLRHRRRQLAASHPSPGGLAVA